MYLLYAYADNSFFLRGKKCEMFKKKMHDIKIQFYDLLQIFNFAHAKRQHEPQDNSDVSHKCYNFDTFLFG